MCTSHQPTEGADSEPVQWMRREASRISHRLIGDETACGLPLTDRPAWYVAEDDMPRCDMGCER